MIEINLTILFKVILLYAINFLAIFYAYRYIFYPNLRWWQKGNICHDNRLTCSAIWASILFFIEIFIYTKKIIFTF